MKRTAEFLLCGLLCIAPALAQPKPDTTPHQIRMVPVDKDVTLEVVDWGGSGPPLVFLAGWGATAHYFDRLAPSFTNHYHVYGITRRGFGLSSKSPPTLPNYDADRLADDDLAVMDALKLDHPILAGHSTAGEEISSIATRHPERVRALIYLEAAWSFAFYDPKGGYNIQVEASTVRRDLEALMLADADPAMTRDLIAKLKSELPLLDKALDRDLAIYEGEPQPKSLDLSSEDERRGGALRAGRRKYTGIKQPFLAIIADPWDCRPDCDKPDQKAWSAEMAAQARAVERDYPNGHVVRLPYASHNLLKTNFADVQREMNAFMDALH